MIGSETDAQSMVDDGGCDVIIDLREEADKPAFFSNYTKWIHIKLKDHVTGQESQIQKAVAVVVEQYNQNKTIGIHCASGVCRTAAVAIGVLIELGVCRKLKEATQYVEISRTQTSLHPNLKDTLSNLYK
nr:dual specificity protein phosphatase family protein [Ammoniphilus resinae]